MSEENEVIEEVEEVEEKEESNNSEHKNIENDGDDIGKKIAFFIVAIIGMVVLKFVEALL